MVQQQQLQAQHLSHGHAIPIPLTPHPAGLQPPLPPGAGTASLLALSSALSHQLPLKDERKHHDNNSEHPRDRDSVKSSSVSPSASFRTGEKHRSSNDYSSDSKKQKTDDKELASTRYVSEHAFDKYVFLFNFVVSVGKTMKMCLNVL